MCFQICTRKMNDEKNVSCLITLRIFIQKRISGATFWKVTPESVLCCLIIDPIRSQVLCSIVIIIENRFLFRFRFNNPLSSNSFNVNSILEVLMSVEYLHLKSKDCVSAFSRYLSYDDLCCRMYIKQNCSFLFHCLLS